MTEEELDCGFRWEIIEIGAELILMLCAGLNKLIILTYCPTMQLVNVLQLEYIHLLF